MKSRQSKQREIIGILLFLLAIFSSISLYFESTGLVGALIKNWLEIAFGETAIIFSIILFFLSICFFRGTYWPIKTRKLIGYLLLFTCFMALYHLLVVYRGYQLPPSMAEEIRYGRMGTGAGVIGAIFMVTVLTAFGRTGSYIMLSGLTFIGFILVFNLSFISIYRKAIALITSNIKDTSAGFRDLLNRIINRFRQFREARALARLEAAVTGPTPETGRAKEAKPQLSEKVLIKSNNTKKTGESTNTELALKREEISKQPTTQRETEKVQPLNYGSTSPSNTYHMPPVYLFKKGSSSKVNSSENRGQLLEDTFESFGIVAKVVNICQGPVVTRYELQIGPGTKVSRITGLADDLALALAATDVRIEAPVPGKSVVGIEVPNKKTQPVLIRDVIEHESFLKHPSKVALALGKDIAGNPVIADLKKWLHLLVAGSTGSGKSVCLNAIVTSLLFRASPEEVKLLMIDPKRVELTNYDGIPHLIAPVVTDLKKAAGALRWAVVEMERRYKLFADIQVRNIESYYEFFDAEMAKSTDSTTEDGEEQVSSKPERLPYIVIIIDELADLMMSAPAEVEDAICRIAQMARATGMYLIVSTQRPSVDVITGLIKANVPSRIAFTVASQVDSRTILDMGGAERLIGKGDMLYHPIGASKPNRAQGAYVSDKEVEALVRFWKKQAQAEYIEEMFDQPTTINELNDDTDELLEDAIRLVVETGQASISMLQRRFRIGYNRAARLIDTMEARSIVGSYQGSKPREVLVDTDSLDF